MAAAESITHDKPGTVPKYPVYRCGIYNLGDTCFLNSSIQVLARVRRFAQWIRNRAYLTTEGWEGKPDHLKHLTNQIQDIFDAIRTPNTTTLTPRGFHMRFRGAAIAENSAWLMGGQNDSHECMMFMLNALHKAVAKDIRSRADVVAALEHEQTLLTNGPTADLREKLDLVSMSNWYSHFGKEYSPIMTNMFHGQFMNIITSRQTNERSFRFEPFSSISIAVPERGPMEGGPDGKGLISIQDCLDKFFASETLTGDSKWESPTAGKVDAVKGARIWRLPEVLILSLKRFTMMGAKVRTRISYPLTGLDMSSYCTGMATDEGDAVYDLVGVVIHMGVLYGGHYISLARNPGGEWIVMNDVQVGLVDPAKVRDNPDAYTLVYQKSSLTAKDDIAEAEWFEKHLADIEKATGKKPPTPKELPDGDEAMEDEYEDEDDIGDFEDGEFDYVPAEGDAEYDIPPDMIDDE